MLSHHKNDKSGNIRRRAFLVMLLLVGFVATYCLVVVARNSKEDAATVIYVDYKIGAKRSTNYDPDTRSCGSGTGIAYRTLKGAAQAARPGQTVLIRAGTYCEQLKPSNSGKPGNYIVFKNYKDEKAVITGPALKPAIDISNKSHIVIDGLNVTNVRRWLYAVSSHHNIIQNNHFSKAVDPGGSSKTGLFFQQATFNRIVNNIIEDSTQDNLSLIRSNRNLIEGNTFRKAVHTLWTIKGGNFNVLRNNYFHNERQKIGEVLDCHDVGFNHEFYAYNCTKHNLIENNRFAFTPSSGKSSPYSGIQYAGQSGIIRNNLFYDTVGPGLSLTLYGKEANFNTGNHIFNNVFYKSQFAGISLSSSKDFAFTGNILKNNILAKSRFVAHDTRWGWYRRELDGKGVQILAGRLDGFVCQNNNLFTKDDKTNYLITLGSRKPLVKSQQTITRLQVKYPSVFVDNTELDPFFVDEKKRDFHLKPASPMIDKGAFLTKTVANGSGTSMQVEDVGYFYDGYDIPGEKGDLIRLKGQDHTARVVDIDYKKNLLVLSQSLTWKKGQGVALWYLGRRPDIGAYEFVPGGNRPPVAAFTGMPRLNEPLVVDFDASDSLDVDGQIVRYDWQFGDGKVAADKSAKLSHTYSRPGIYTVTLKVIDNGRPGLTGVATILVSVGKPVLSVKPKSLEFGIRDTDLRFEITNTGEGTLVYRITTSAPWLSVNPSSGTCTAETDLITAQVNRADLDIGDYTGTITVDAGAGGKRQIVVAMKIQAVTKTSLIKIGDTWRFFKGTIALPGEWKTAKYNDSNWLEGPTGIGFSSDKQYPTTLDDMRGNYITVFMRRKFRIEDIASVIRLHLGIKYDDGFVAYINGKEVARSRSMGAPNTNVRFYKGAISRHDEEAPEETYSIEVTPGLLLPGQNVLAIEFHNEWIKGSDACAIPRLNASVVTDAKSSAGFKKLLVLPLFGSGIVAAIAFWLLGKSRRKRLVKVGGERVLETPSRRLLWRKRWEVLNWAAVGVTAIAIIVLSHCPPEVLRLGRHDKKAHAAAYGLLAFFLLGAINRRGRIVKSLSVVLRAIDSRIGLIRLLVVLGVITLICSANELTQPLVGRHRSMADLLAGVAGALLAILLWQTTRFILINKHD